MSSKSLIRLTFNRKQNTDAGMALVLLMLLTGYFTGNTVWYIVSIPVLFITMALPGTLYPFSVIWFNLSELAGNILSKAVLTLVYCLLVVPVGIIRRMTGRDVLKLKQFKRNDHSVLLTRNIEYSRDDIIHPF